MKPPLRWPPPVKPATFCTAGSLLTIFMNWIIFCDMAWNEML